MDLKAWHRPALVFGLVMAVAGCAGGPDRLNGDAAPAGGIGSPSAPGASAPASPPAAGQPSTSPPAATTRPGSTSPVVTTTRPGSTRRGPGPGIRQTNWPNSVIQNLRFCAEPDRKVTFRNGTNGLDIPCLILPGGAAPVYADFLVEEPANAPRTEDALVLVELGNPGAARRQALVPVQVGFDGRTLAARGHIAGDDPSPAGDRVMTFISYRILDGNRVEAKVRRLDGTTETRRYRQQGMTDTWERI